MVYFSVGALWTSRSNYSSSVRLTTKDVNEVYRGYLRREGEGRTKVVRKHSELESIRRNESATDQRTLEVNEVIL